MEKGDYFSISGQKIWTSFAHVADYAYLVARTDPTAPTAGAEVTVQPVRLGGGAGQAADT